MNKKIMIAAMGALALTFVGSLSADVGTAKTKPAMKDSSGPVDRTFELRVGPRASFLSGDLRVGKNGTTMDLFDDMKLDGANIGTQLDFDWQPWNRIHLTVGATYDSYDQSGNTTKNLVTASHGNATVLSGANVNAKMDIFTVDAELGYEIIKNNTYRLKPYVGGKGIFVDARATVSGTVTSTTNVGTNTRTGTTTVTNKREYGTFFGGVDQRLYISRDWYAGIDVGGFGLDQWGYITGDGYMGYDFSKSIGLRVGYAADYITYETANKATEANPLLGAAYVQFVWGF